MKALLPLFLLIANVYAYAFERFELYEAGLIETRSCHMAIYKSATFCTKQATNSFSCYCSNKDAMASLVGCAKYIRPKSHNFEDFFIKYCAERNITITESTLKQSAQYLVESGKNFTAAKAVNSTGSTVPKVEYPIYVNKTLAKGYYQGYSSLYGNFNWSYWFSNILYVYWGFVFVLAAGCNWGVAIFPKLRTTFNGRVSKAWRKHVTLPALIRKKRISHQGFLGVLDFLVPSRLETLVLTAFFWLTFLFNVLFMTWHAGNPVYTTKHGSILRMVADRTGIMGTMLLPLLILIGGRNNFLQWLTRWKYSSFLTYHRWIGRVIVALVFIHSIAYGAIRYSRLRILMGRTYIIYGTMATAAGIIICFQGLLVLRRRFYEIFLSIHILMALAFMIGTWIHLDTFMYMEWVIASCAVWGLDRLVRIARMLCFGAPNATVTLLSDDCLRITVPKPKYWKSSPGGHAWVYFLSGWYFWQSHPFTFLDCTVESNTIIFLVKAKKGATHYLAKKLNNLPGKTTTIRVCVEGPYGESCSVKYHDNVVFVAGGNGIPGIFAECYALAKASANTTQRIKLIWVLREISAVEWVWQELQALKATKVETTVYITRVVSGDAASFEKMIKDTSSEENDTKEENDAKEDKRDSIDMLNDHFTHVTFIYGRPSMDVIVNEETTETSKSAAFITCGHPVMVDDLRYAVVHKIDTTEKRVDFFEQLQVWA